MNRVEGNSRVQLEFGCLEDSISKDNPVKVIGAFVDKLELEKVGFVGRQAKVEGPLPFEKSIFLMIYLYGYISGIRGSIANSAKTSSSR